MTYYPNNPNGQAAMANSAPVVIASNQSAVPVSGTISASITGTIPTTISSGTITDITNAVTVIQPTATSLKTQAENYVGGSAVSISNQLQVASSAATATVTSVSASATSITILASNASRKGAMLFNDSNQTLYLLFGSGVASASNYSVRIPSNSYFDLDMPVYTGQLNGLWNSANGSVKVTELT